MTRTLHRVYRPPVLFTSGWETPGATGNLTGTGVFGWPEVAAADRFCRAAIPYPVRSGGYSARVCLRPGDDPKADGSSRCEVSLPRPNTASSIYIGENTPPQYTGFSVRLDPNWAAPDGANPFCLVAQLHGPDALGQSPILCLKAESTFYVELRAGDKDDGSNTWPTYALSDNALEKGKWVDFIFYIKFARAGGLVRVWRRDEGDAQFAEVAAITTHDYYASLPTLQWDSSGVIPEAAYWKFGIYRNSGNTGTHQMWCDGFIISRNFQDVVRALTAGKTNLAVVGSRSFNGTTNRLDWANIFNPKGSALTISAWMKGSSFGNNYFLCVNRDASNTGIAFSNIHSSGQLQFLRTGTTSLYRYTAQSLFSTGTWYHVLVTHDGAINTYSSIHIYVNGTECSYTGGGGQNGASEHDHSSTWSVGGRVQDDIRNFNGLLAQVAVWDAVLSAGNIGSLAAGAAPSTLPTNLRFYYPGNTDPLTDTVTEKDATADGSTQSTDGPTITY
jgi:hypothetical protein